MLKCNCKLTKNVTKQPSIYEFFFVIHSTRKKVKYACEFIVGKDARYKQTIQEKNERKLKKRVKVKKNRSRNLNIHVQSHRNADHQRQRIFIMYMRLKGKVHSFGMLLRRLFDSHTHQHYHTCME